MNLPALHEALDALAQACTAIENGSAYSTETHLTEASLAAAVAFPAGSQQGRSLNDIIGAVWAEAQVAGLLERAA